MKKILINFKVDNQQLETYNEVPTVVEDINYTYEDVTDPNYNPSSQFNRTVTTSSKVFLDNFQKRKAQEKVLGMMYAWTDNGGYLNLSTIDPPAPSSHVDIEDDDINE